MSPHHKKRNIIPTTSSSSPPPLPYFPSHLQSPNLPPNILLLCEAIASSSVESALHNLPTPISSSDVESVLKLSYSHPASAVKFFRLVGPPHSPYSWNLLVDLLGKNLLFDAMWDALHSMRSQNLVSLATFASIFSSFSAAGRPSAALSAFHQMPSLGVSHDVAALNSLLSALSRENLTTAAVDCFRQIRKTIEPDSDSYAILLEGFENERNYEGARDVFDDMILRLGWDPRNVPAYDSFLNLLLCNGERGLDECLRWVAEMNERKCFPGTRFLGNAIEECARVNDVRAAVLLWDSIVGRNGCLPNTEVCNSMISLYCDSNKLEAAYRFFDDMVVYGAFPDSRSYELMLRVLIRSRRVGEVVVLVGEMVKNEIVPSAGVCDCVMSLLMEERDWERALKVWRIMVEKGIAGERIGNLLIVGLRDYSLMPEACKYAEEMIEEGIKLQSSTLSKLKISLQKLGKGYLYDNMLRKWKKISSDRVS